MLAQTQQGFAVQVAIGASSLERLGESDTCNIIINHDNPAEDVPPGSERLTGLPTPRDWCTVVYYTPGGIAQGRVPLHSTSTGGEVQAVSCRKAAVCVTSSSLSSYRSLLAHALLATHDLCLLGYEGQAPISDTTTADNTHSEHHPPPSLSEHVLSLR